MGWEDAQTRGQATPAPCPGTRSAGAPAAGISSCSPPRSPVTSPSQNDAVLPQIDPKIMHRATENFTYQKYNPYIFPNFCVTNMLIRYIRSTYTQNTMKIQRRIRCPVHTTLAADIFAELTRHVAVEGLPLGRVLDQLLRPVLHLEFAAALIPPPPAPVWDGKAWVLPTPRACPPGTAGHTKCSKEHGCFLSAKGRWLDGVCITSPENFNHERCTMSKCQGRSDL